MPLIECKIPGVLRVWCQFEDSHFATVPLSSPKQPAGIRESTMAETTHLEGRESIVGGVYLAEVAVLDLVTVRLGKSHALLICAPPVPAQ